MSEFAIKVENLGKLYQIGTQQEQYKTLREALVSHTKKITIKHPAQPSKGTFWALKDVSFEVKLGEIVGIIGRNGAGKSTLLKILSHITEPTEGRVSLDGRVGSLLEVGTGFHPELTGRENIFLNGAILGMKKIEIERKFDEIVAFAEIEKFLDTPVKRYSSGMYVRLAFAVSAHLDPEILVIDEVLAVGDTAFQKKCLGKIGEVNNDGRTVLFVSHNLGVVANLCKRTIYLEKGYIVFDGDTHPAITKYMSVPTASGICDLNDVKTRSGNGLARFNRIVTKKGQGEVSDTFVIGDDIDFDIIIKCYQIVQKGRMSIRISSIEGISIYHFVSSDAGFELNDLREIVNLHLVIKNQKLYPGVYYVTLWLATSNQETLDYIVNAIKFTVIDGGIVVTRPLDLTAAIIHEIPEWTRIS